MKKTIIYSVLLIAVSAMYGCGGSGTPLPPSQKVATITFKAVSTAHNFAISNYTFNTDSNNPVVLPSMLSLPTTSSTDLSILTAYLIPTNSNIFSSSYVASNYPNGDGKVEFTAVSLTVPPTNIGFGKFAELKCVLKDNTMTKQAVFAAYTSSNRTANRIVRAKQFDPSDPLNANNLPLLPVFYNISVSVQ